MNRSSEGRKTIFQDGEGISLQEWGIRPQAAETRGPPLWTRRQHRTVHAATLWKPGPRGPEVTDTQESGPNRSDRRFSDPALEGASGLRVLQRHRTNRLRMCAHREGFILRNWFLRW